MCYSEYYKPNEPPSKSLNAERVIEKFNAKLRDLEADSMRYFKKAPLDAVDEAKKLHLLNTDTFSPESERNPNYFERQVQAHRDLSLPGRSSNPSDMYNIREHAFDKTFSDLQSDLALAVQARKQSAAK